MSTMFQSKKFHNNIATIALSHFKALPKKGKPTPEEWTVVSAIVKENGHIFEVVSLGTGSKCIGRNSMSNRGDVLNDSHAEVIARRAFLKYLYSEIVRIQESEIFELQNGCIVLKRNVKFHFFTTHVPCGDAAIFPKSDQEDYGKCVDITVKRPADTSQQGFSKSLKMEGGDIYRTGSKCLPLDSEQDPHLEGANYHLTGKVRTKPGRGDPTLSVSCSDKLTRWLQIGLQGALLSLILAEPIRFSSFTITKNVPFSKDALLRCLFGRLQSACKKIELFVGQADVTFDHNKRNDKRPSANSIVWYKYQSSSVQEVAAGGRRLGITKKLKGDPKSRLSISKVELFISFIQTVKSITEVPKRFQDIEKRSYAEVKLLASEYQYNWLQLKKDGFRIWTVKDKALLGFHVT